MSTGAHLQLDHTPKPRVFHEKIGDTEYEIAETKLDVLNDVVLWTKNPRLQRFVTTGTESESELEAHLRRTNGYDSLAKSIAELGQMEPIYVWRGDDQNKYLVLEGATRVTILRDLARKKKNQPEGAKYQRVKAKVLPKHFDEAARVILLARVHVRGTGVRAWGRYVEAKFVYDNTYPENGQGGVMSVTELAKYMEKSISWVSRLRDAYRFARSFVEYLDSPDADTLAAEHFSTLEEISKASGFGPKVREYGNRESDALRAEVFEMVRQDVFKEYRDARFMKDFHDDPEKWAQLKTHEKHIANRLAKDIAANGSSLKVKIGALEGQISRALEQNKDALDESDVESLRKALELTESRVVHVGVSACQIAFRNFQHALENATLADVRAITPEQFAELTDALDDFRERAARHNKSWAQKNG